MEIIILKKCCGAGYKTALLLRQYFELKGYEVILHGKKADRFKEELSTYSKVFTGDPIYLIRELNLCLYENEVGKFLKGEL